MSRLLVQIGQGESLVHFFVSGFAKSPKSDRSSGEKRTGRFIANALFAEVPKSVFGIVVRVEEENRSGRALLMVTPMSLLVCRNLVAAAIP